MAVNACRRGPSCGGRHADYLAAWKKAALYASSRLIIFLHNGALLLGLLFTLFADAEVCTAIAVSAIIVFIMLGKRVRFSENPSGGERMPAGIKLSWAACKLFGSMEESGPSLLYASSRLLFFLHNGALMPGLLFTLFTDADVCVATAVSAIIAFIML